MACRLQRGQAATASLTRKISREGGDAEEVMRAGLARATEIASRYPRLRSRLESAASGYGAAPEHAFEYGLQAVLDGLEAELVDRSAAADRHGRQPRREGQVG